MRDTTKSLVSLLVSIATSLFGYALGYAYSQTQLGKVVAVHESRINGHDTRLREISDASGAHMNEAIELFKKAEESRQESERTTQRLIALIEIQYGLRGNNKP